MSKKGRPRGSFRSPRLLSLNKLARLLDVGTATVAALVRHGDFPAPIQIGDKRRWRSQDVDLWLDKCPDVNGKLAADPARLPWLINPIVLEEMLAPLGSVQVFPACNSAVYFLIRDGRVMYVGQTTDLPGRISSHRLAGKQDPARCFDSTYYLPTEEASLLELERRYIILFAPSWNVQGNPGAGAP